ncbi:galactosylgalactosylxylosylprotein 3-beta-glucuronosyltransferase 1-like [Haliotis cracherodii]|uniref:galactosylgalactosylxylosylprotein 3-beta-glucuronosyltransferase 1-like n=1 Tax=Haliotis cracherodii TaxID=6455 RepID=UPI0039EC8DFF
MPGLLTMFRRPRRLVYVFFLLFVLAWMLFKSDTCNRTANTVTKSGRQSNGIFEVKARRNWEKINLRHKLQTTRTKNEIKPETKKSQYWHFVLDDGEKRHRKFGPTIPVIYAITPTYSRLEQKAELTRLSQTFLHLSHFHWILVEDSENKTSLVINLLRSSGLSYTHLHALTPPNVKLKPTDAPYSKPRGVSQRNAGLSWIRDNLDPETQSGVVYFADDDNTYDLQVFDEMRVTQKVAVWPVGFTGHLKYGGPVVTHGKVTGWLTGLELHRPFAIDMAGFAINIKLFFQYPEAQFSNYKVRSGFQESHILQRLHISLNDLEPLADNCTKVLVWHTRTEKPRTDAEARNRQKLLKGPYFSMVV